MKDKDLEKIIHDLKGISYIENKDKLVSHVENIYDYPKEGIYVAAYNRYISREWSSDDSVPGGGAGDWYESEIITNEYMFLEKKSEDYHMIGCYAMKTSNMVNDVKKALEIGGHKIDYIIKRETVDGPNWGWFSDTVYIVTED